ncbi:SusC/RagA family TonB-linked outer membrane protein [Pinibacter aurantiacus]|uniref:TonB-dependent receptor n=1 Tax=Pinibacter aurantiacus TaxID=2851599 RepID=A0A9E2S513_9BACT|nr:TonB-dependent receptor [Pinibacter aurantiacus]MBV4356768.1 TonB-dependent receptor [Pinibacter aurantiacus]
MTKLTKLVLVLFFAFALCHISWAQSRTISGTVSDNNGNPLSRATVAVKNSKVVTLTDADGKFSLKVPDGATTIVVSNVGTSTKEIAIGTDNVFAVVLQSSRTQLSDIVVVGYGSLKRANLSTAQTSINSKAIEKTVNTTIEQALQGRAAGVYVTQNSGQPGGAMSVNIRGVSTINGTSQPLYVIDGVQSQPDNVNNTNPNATSSSPLSGLNPADVDDIQILQGPSATAIYGSRATNGVVIITTKRGRAGDFKVNYGYQYGLQTPPDNLPVMNLSQYASMVKQYHNIAGGTTPGEFLDSSLLGPGTDWQAELFNNAAMNKHQLSLSGGSGNTTYYLSGEYLDQRGVAAGSGFKRYGTRLNLDNKPRTWLNIGANLAFNQTDENLVTTNYGDAQSPLIANALRLTPQIPVTNFDGSWGGSDPVNGANQYAPINPIALADLITNTNTRRQLTGGLNVGITLTKGLTFRSSLNASYGNGFSTYYVPTYQIDQWHYNAIASLSSGTSTNSYWNWNQQLEYIKQIGKHNITVMGTHESQESKWQNLTAGRTGFLTNDIFDVKAGDPLTATNDGGRGSWAMESYLARIAYNYDNRYILQATYRTDGSPYFGPENRWAKFPSVSAAWRVSQEKFFDVPWISELKLRYETGLTGNQGYGSGIYAGMATGATPWGTGFLSSIMKNPTLQWEETNTNNYGINLGFLHNRITLDANYYERTTGNMIFTGIVPWYQGANGSPGAVQAPFVNAGDMRTKGWDFTINASIIDNKDFKWDANLNISHFKSTVKSLNNGQTAVDRVSWWMNTWTQRAAVDQQPWLFRGYIEDGLFQSIADINKSPVPVDNGGNRIQADPNTGLWVGDVKYKDLNGDGKITVDDMTNIGNPWPKLMGGLTNTFSYKGFELSMLIMGTYGNQIYNYIAYEASNPNNINLSRNLLVKAMEYAKVDNTDLSNPKLSNPGTDVPRITNNQIASQNNYSKNTSRFVEDGSYLRLKNISLTYDVPAKWLGYTKVIKGFRATVGVQNVFTITHYKGYDPEIGSYVGTGTDRLNQAIGIDFGRFPLTRMYNAAISVNF